MKKRYLVIILALVLTMTALAQAQDTPADDINPDANISWPPPVYVLRGDVPIMGTANVGNMTNYFLEYRLLNDDLSPQDDDAPWFPAILPVAQRMLEGELGVWDTELASDGVYELRLTVNTSDGNPVYHVVSPLRIENEPPPFVSVDVAPTTAPAAATPQPAVPTVRSRPTLAATPTAIDTTPRVTARVNANVRRGDSTLHDVVATLNQGETAAVIGRSSTGSGWYFIELDNGVRGFIAPSTVIAAGDLRDTPFINPPPPPVTPTFTPSPTPITTANLVITAITTDPAAPRCNQTFTIFVTIQNVGTGATNTSGSINVVDTHAGTGSVSGSTVGGFPVLQPGQSFTGIIPLTVSTFYNEQHNITITIDSLGQVAETNEGDNVAVHPYVLQQAGCS